MPLTLRWAILLCIIKVKKKKKKNQLPNTEHVTVLTSKTLKYVKKKSLRIDITWHFCLLHLPSEALSLQTSPCKCIYSTTCKISHFLSFPCIFYIVPNLSAYPIHLPLWRRGTGECFSDYQLLCQALQLPLSYQSHSSFPSML